MEMKQLTQIAQANETSKNIFEVFSTRERFRRETDLRRLQRTMLEAGKKVVDDEFINLFNKLQDIGVGTLIIGRGNKMTRFKWHYNLRDVAKAALTNKKVPAAAKLDKVDKEPAKTQVPKVETAPTPPESITMSKDQLKNLVAWLMDEMKEK